MESVKRITDNELKISINQLKDEINKSDISSSNIEECMTLIKRCKFESTYYLVLLIALVISTAFATYPLIPVLLSLTIILKRKKISNKISKLKEMFEKELLIESMNNAQLILKDNELEVRQTVLDYRNGIKLSSDKINNLNIFSFLAPELNYDLKEINEKYNYQFDEKVLEGQGWRFIPASQMNDEMDCEVLKEKVLKR